MSSWTRKFIQIYFNFYHFVLHSLRSFWWCCSHGFALFLSQLSWCRCTCAFKIVVVEGIHVHFGDFPNNIIFITHSEGLIAGNRMWLLWLKLSLRARVSFSIQFFLFHSFLQGIFEAYIISELISDKRGCGWFIEDASHSERRSNIEVNGTESDCSGFSYLFFWG